MQLTIQGQPVEFISLKTFRERHHLSDEFGIAYFEPKSPEGLGSIDRAGVHLNRLRHAVVGALPPRLTPNGWMNQLVIMEGQFRENLEHMNKHVGLRQNEIDFAVAGYTEVMRTIIYDMIRSQAAHQKPTEFDRIYQQWLMDTVRLTSTVHHYEHQGQGWHIQVINHAYGRVGLRVTTPQAVYHVADDQLACPAEGFMVSLLREVAAHIQASVTP